MENTDTERKEEDEEISLIDLFAVVWRFRKMIIIITAIAMAGAVGFSVLSLLLPPETSPLPNEYAPKAAMLINDSGSSGGGLSSMIASSGLGGLAGLAGVSGGSTYSALAVYLLSSNSLLDAVVDEFGLVERYKIKKFLRADSRKALSRKLTGDFDDESGVFSITFSDMDPAFAQRVVNYCVDYLDRRFGDLGLDKNKLEKENLEKNIDNTYNEIMRLEREAHDLEFSVPQRDAAGMPSIALNLSRINLELAAQRQVYSQLKVQYELVKVTIASESPVFQILEYAEVPDKKSKPSRGMLCIIVTFAAGFLSVFLAFTRNAVENIKKDPEAMAKLRASASPRLGRDAGV